MEHHDVPLMSARHGDAPRTDACAAQTIPPRIPLLAAAAACVCSAVLYPSLARALSHGDAVFGINVPICVAAVYTAYFGAMGGLKRSAIRRGIWGFALILPIACAPAFFSVPELTAVNLLALLIAVPMHMSLLSGSDWPILEGCALLGAALHNVLGRPVAYIGKACHAASRGPGRGTARNALLVLAGLAAALPPLTIVVFLLCRADEGFAEIVTALFSRFDIAQIVAIPAVAAALAFPLLSAFFSFVSGLVPARRAAGTSARKTPSLIPIYAALGAFNLVLAVFATLQVGRILSATPFAGYAQSAHEGFFPMVTAAFLCYGVVSLCLRRAGKAGKRPAFRVLITVLAGSLLIMMISAMKSILIYQGAMGLSRLRVYVTFAIAALFLFLILTLVRVWSGRPVRALMCAVLCASLIGINYMNLDRTIAQYNLALADRNGTVADAGYLLSLSADAVHMIEVRLRANPEAHPIPETVLAAARIEEIRAASSDARVWNLGRRRAARLKID